MEFVRNIFIDLANKHIATLSLIPLFALTVAILNYRRKSGIDIRSEYEISSIQNCSNQYVSSVTLENMKDRPHTIYSIFLRIGRNIYIEIENFDKNPLIIKPFETWSNKYGPVDHYASGLQKAILDFSLISKSNRIILSTHKGRYVSKKIIKKWEPSKASLKNSTIEIIRPSIYHYKGRRFGDLVHYVVILEHTDSNDEFIEITKDSHKQKIFDNFIIDPAVLKTENTLIDFLNSKKHQGQISCKNIKVINLIELRKTSITQITEISEKIKPAKLIEFHKAGIVSFLRMDHVRRLIRRF